MANYYYDIVHISDKQFTIVSSDYPTLNDFLTGLNGTSFPNGFLNRDMNKIIPADIVRNSIIYFSATQDAIVEL